MTARTPQTYAVFGFATTHAALDAEQLLKDLGISVAPVPVPKALGGELCGIALRVHLSHAERALTLLERADMSPAKRSEMQDV
ncbi:MAG: DUF3343 domain-containing protein [Coriobacteriia bacterium]|nr:DUF3343 domain-containing protein [Coriobacteriia bacterium]